MKTVNMFWVFYSWFCSLFFAFFYYFIFYILHIFFAAFCAIRLHNSSFKFCLFFRSFYAFLSLNYILYTYYYAAYTLVFIIYFFFLAYSFNFNSHFQFYLLFAQFGYSPLGQLLSSSSPLINMFFPFQVFLYFMDTTTTTKKRFKKYLVFATCQNQENLQ